MICRYFSNLSIIYRDYSDIITQSYNTFIKLSLFLQILWINHDFTTPLPPISELVTHMAFKYGSSHPSRDPQLRPGWRGSRLGKSRRGQPGIGLGLSGVSCCWWCWWCWWRRLKKVSLLKDSHVFSKSPKLLFVQTCWSTGMAENVLRGTKNKSGKQVQQIYVKLPSKLLEKREDKFWMKWFIVPLPNLTLLLPSCPVHQRHMRGNRAICDETVESRGVTWMLWMWVSGFRGGEKHGKFETLKVERR